MSHCRVSTGTPIPGKMKSVDAYPVQCDLRAHNACLFTCAFLDGRNSPLPLCSPHLLHIFYISPFFPLVCFSGSEDLGEEREGHDDAEVNPRSSDGEQRKPFAVEIAGKNNCVGKG